MLTLNIKTSESANRSIQLNPGINRIGRSPVNDHCIDDSTISGHHCEITVSGQTVTIRDLDSTNGTFIGGQRIREAVLLHGQTLHLGRVEMLLDAVAVEIAIPEFLRKEEISPTAIDGVVACVNHRSSPAIVECPQCQKAFCECCVHQVRLVGGAALTLCPACSGHCRSIAREVVIPKRKSRVGSWIGNVTAKMTGRFTRPNP